MSSRRRVSWSLLTLGLYLLSLTVLLVHVGNTTTLFAQLPLAFLIISSTGALALLIGVKDQQDILMEAHELSATGGALPMSGPVSVSGAQLGQLDSEHQKLLSLEREIAALENDFSDKYREGLSTRGKKR